MAGLGQEGSFIHTHTVAPMLTSPLLSIVGRLCLPFDKDTTTLALVLTSLDATSPPATLTVQLQ